MHKLLAILILLLSYLLTTAQVRLDKIVFVTPSRLPISEVVVQNAARGFATLSNESGIIYLQNLPSDIRSLSVSHLGYEPARLELDSVSPVNGTITVTLKQKHFTLADVTVMAARKSGFQTLSDIDIRLRPVNNSQEILRLVPGLFIGQHAGGGKAEQIFLRGFDIDHGTDIHLSVDGLPVNMVSHAHGQGYADLHFLIPELVEKVRFQKGSYAAETGNFATAGHVAFRTRDRLDKNFIKAEGGQFGTGRFVGGVSLLKPTDDNSNRSLFVAGEAMTSRGYFNHPQDFRRFNSLVKYNTTFGSRGSLTALLSGFSSRWNSSGQIPDRAVAEGRIGFFGAIDPTEGGNTSRYNASIELLNRSRNGAEWRNQVFYSYYDFQLYSNFTFFKEDPVNGDRIRQKERRQIFGYNGSFRKEQTFAGLPAVATVGIQLRHDNVKDNELSRVDDQYAVTNILQLGNINETNAAAYVSQKLQLQKRFSLTAGLRFDHFNNRYYDKVLNKQGAASAFILSPKLLLDYAASRNVQLYMYNGRGFHSNDTRVVVAQRGRQILPPAYSTDLGGIFKFTPRLVVQAALWHLWLDQEFVYVGDEGIVEAGGRTRRLGADMSVRYEFLQNFFANLDVNYASARLLDEPKEANRIPLAPRLTSVGGLVYKKQTGFGGSLLYRYMGDRPAVEDNSIVAQGYTVFDANVLYTAPKWEAGISIQNLFNARWKETQFATESRLQNEPDPITEIHFTPGTPFFARASFTLFF